MIKTYCIYDRKHQNAAVKGAKGTIPRVLFGVIFLTLCELAAVGLFVSFLLRGTSSLKLFPVMTAAATVYMLYMIFVLTIHTIQFYNLAYTLFFRNGTETTENEFSEDRIVHISVYKKERKTVTLRYEAVKTASEADGFFVICSDESTFSVAYADFKEGTPDDLRILVAEKLGSRFVIK